MSKRGCFTVTDRDGQQVIRTSVGSGVSIAFEVKPDATAHLSPADYEGGVHICTRTTRKGRVLYDVVGSRIIARDIESYEEAEEIRQSCLT